MILVNDRDESIGTMDKMEAHMKGCLHRAFSVFIFNNKGEMLLQQRAIHKYHSGGLWTNACCSHPLPEDNDLCMAAKRRLKEEMGFDADIEKTFSFIYKADVDNGLVEHEYDHVFTGRFEGKISPDNSEVKDYCYMKMEAIRAGIQSHPQKYTPWFKIAFPKLETYLASKAV